MLLKKIKLHPFAGLNEFEVTLQGGLNVIHGPNEAGKSTIVRAIQFAFFSPAKLAKKEREQVAHEFFPKTGGDTIRVTLEFSINGKVYILKRTWGGTESTILYGEDIGEITNAETALSKLSEFLQLNRATWENILFSHQALLGQTFNNISENYEIKNSISDILRGSVISSAGVSIENLKNSLEESITSYFNNWDDSIDRPNGGREVDNRWKQKVGDILHSYYEYKQGEFDLESRISYDEQIDSFVKQISEKKTKLTDIKLFVDKNKQIVEDARSRAVLDANHRQKKLERTTLTEDAELWNNSVASLPVKKQLISSLDKDIEELKKELATANLKEGIKEKQQKLKKAEAILIKISSLKDEVKKLKKVNPGDLDEFEALEDAIEKLELRLDEQKLAFNIKAKNEIEGFLQKGVEEKKKTKILKGKFISGEASGKFHFETEDLVISVESGTENVGSIMKKIDAKRIAIEKLKKKYDVKTFSQLEKMHTAVEDKNDAIENQENTLEIVLDGDNIETLRKDLKKIDSLPSTRPSKKIIEEAYKKKAQSSGVKHEINSLTEVIGKFEKKYKTLKNLNEHQMNCGVAIKEIENKIAGLKPLPLEVKNADTFIKEYNSKSEELVDLKDLLGSVQIEMKEFEKQEPPLTAEELKEKIVSSKKEYQLKLKEGQAYKQIFEKLSLILASDAENVFQPFEEKLCHYFSELTGGKYKKIALDEVLPTTIKNDKIELPIDLLSKGTKDSLALAQKLSMAGYYLRNSKGFLVLDDPLTDMDPGRKKAAVNVIREFSKEKQLLIFTCDPVHSKMFGIQELQLN
jgi:exonuclease SbcC